MRTSITYFYYVLTAPTSPLTPSSFSFLTFLQFPRFNVTFGHFVNASMNPIGWFQFFQISFLFLLFIVASQCCIFQPILIPIIEGMLLTSMMFLFVRDSWGSLYSVYLRRTWKYHHIHRIVHNDVHNHVHRHAHHHIHHHLHHHVQNNLQHHHHHHTIGCSKLYFYFHIVASSFFINIDSKGPGHY